MLRLNRLNPLCKTQIRFSSSIPRTIEELLTKSPEIGSNLTVNGYIKSIRHLKKVSFIDLYDGSSAQTLMCVFPASKEAVESDFSRIQVGQSVSISGNWTASKGSGQQFELKSSHSGLSVLGQVPEQYPLQLKSQPLEFLRTLPTLRFKTGYLGSILRLRSNIEYKLNEFFHNAGFIKTTPPLISGSDCEGAGELFEIESRSFLQNKSGKDKFFGKTAYLSVSSQLHLEALCQSVGNVWCLNPAFRAEASDTNRHLSEFWMLEAELPFINDVRQLTQFSESMIKHVIRALAENENGMAQDFLSSQRSADDPSSKVSQLKQKWETLLRSEWKTVTYAEAIDLLNSSKVEFQIPVDYNEGLASEHEKWLAGEYFHSPVFVIDYPKDIKSFYMKQNGDGKTVACFDLLVPEVGEIIGGSLREDNFEKLVAEINRRNMNLDELQWYLSMRQNATVPHGGFGLGFERLVCYLGEISNIRDSIPFPRSRNECNC